MKNIQKIILAITIALIPAILFCGCGAVGSNKSLGTVNGEKITIGEYNFFLQFAKLQMQEKALSENVENLWETEIDGKKAVDVAKEKALEAVVKYKVELAKANEMGVTLTDEETQQVIENKKSISNNFPNREDYLKYLKEIGFNDKDFTEFLENQKLTEKLYFKIISENEEYNISEKEIEDYYNENKDQFKASLVKAKHILIRTVDDNNQPLSEDKQKKAKEKAEDILNKINSGEDFDKLMNEHSEDPGLKAYPDGYVFGKNQGFAKEFEETAFSLKKGEVSDLVKTDFGYHIIKVEDKYEYLPLAQIKSHVESFLVNKKYNDKVEEWKKAFTISPDEEAIKKIKFKTE